MSFWALNISFQEGTTLLSIFAPSLDCALREGISNLWEEMLPYFFFLWLFVIRGGNASGMASASAA